MLPALFHYSLLAVMPLSGLVSAAALPEQDHAVPKPQLCASFSPGAFDMGPSVSPFHTCKKKPQTVSWIFQDDGNFVVYNAAHTAVWNSGTYGHTCAGNNCTLAFQHDGNLVIYYNRVPIWYTGTGAGIGKSLMFQNEPPYMAILNGSGGYAWAS